MGSRILNVRKLWYLSINFLKFLFYLIIQDIISLDNFLRPTSLCLKQELFFGLIDVTPKLTPTAYIFQIQILPVEWTIYFFQIFFGIAFSTKELIFYLTIIYCCRILKNQFSITAYFSWKTCYYTIFCNAINICTNNYCMSIFISKEIRFC